MVGFDTQELFLKNYFDRVTDEECKRILPYVSMGVKDNKVYFIRPKQVMTRKSSCEQYKERDGFSYFAYDIHNEKMTQGRQCSFIDSKKLGLDKIASFDLEFTALNLIYFELNVKRDELLKQKKFEGFSSNTRDKLKELL